MNTCPFNHTAPATALPATLPPRIAKLRTHRGYPVPWFVADVDGTPDFRIADGAKILRAIRFNLCWTCGEPLGKHKAFNIGPMCGVNRTNPEPPSHLECAQFSAITCPFLSRPSMKRREDKVTETGHCPGEAIKRNPGVVGVWVVTDYHPFSDGEGGILFNLPDPIKVEWYSKGCPATRAEVQTSINSGEPILRAMCQAEPTAARQAAAHAELDGLLNAMQRYIPET